MTVTVHIYLQLVLFFSVLCLIVSDFKCPDPLQMQKGFLCLFSLGCCISGII